MHATLLAAAAMLGLAVAQVPGALPVRTASEQTGVDAGYRTASEATGVGTNYQLASEQTGVDNGRPA